MVLYKISEDSSGNIQAKIHDSWDHNYVVTNLVSSGDSLLVGDVIHSISVLELKDGRLHIKARDHSALWPFRIQSLDDGGIVVGNVSVLLSIPISFLTQLTKVDRALTTFRSQNSDNRMILERDGSYNLHELVTKFIPGA